MSFFSPPVMYGIRGRLSCNVGKLFNLDDAFTIALNAAITPIKAMVELTTPTSAIDSRVDISCRLKSE